MTFFIFILNYKPQTELMNITVMIRRLRGDFMQVLHKKYVIKPSKPQELFVRPVAATCNRLCILHLFVFLAVV